MCNVCWHGTEHITLNTHTHIIGIKTTYIVSMYMLRIPSETARRSCTQKKCARCGIGYAGKKQKSIWRTCGARKSSHFLSWHSPVNMVSLFLLLREICTSFRFNYISAMFACMCVCVCSKRNDGMMGAYGVSQFTISSARAFYIYVLVFYAKFTMRVKNASFIEINKIIRFTLFYFILFDSN